MEWRYLLEVSEISDKSVGEYNGMKKYSATGDIDYNKIVNFKEVDYETKPSRANRMVLEGEILFAKMKGTTKVLKITDEIANEYIFSTGFTTLKNKEDLDKDYLYYVLISEYFQTEKDKYCSGATQKAINNTNLKKIKIPVPPMEIQEKIVQVLDQAQALIDKRKEQIQALDLLIESIFYTMFGDPVKNEKGWEVKALGDCINHINNGLQRRGKDDDGEIVLRLVELQSNYIDYSNYNRIKLEKGEREKYQIFNEDVLFARVNGNPDYVGRSSVYYEKTDEKVYFNDHIIRASFDLKKINPLYITTLLNTQYGIGVFKEYIKTSAGQFTINQNGIKSLTIPLPHISLQNKFTEKVKTIEKQKQFLNQSLELLEENYKSIMDKAFKGQLFN